MPETTTAAPDDAFEYLQALRIGRHCDRIREHLHAGDVTRASYYADRVLVLVGKAITEEPTNA